jgi:hypothetical protein
MKVKDGVRVLALFLIYILPLIVAYAYAHVNGWNIEANLGESGGAPANGFAMGFIFIGVIWVIVVSVFIAPTVMQLSQEETEK